MLKLKPNLEIIVLECENRQLKTISGALTLLGGVIGDSEPLMKSILLNRFELRSINRFHWFEFMITIDRYQYEYTKFPNEFPIHLICRIYIHISNPLYMSHIGTSFRPIVYVTYRNKFPNHCIRRVSVHVSNPLYSWTFPNRFPTHWFCVFSKRVSMPLVLSSFQMNFQLLYMWSLQTCFQCLVYVTSPNVFPTLLYVEFPNEFPSLVYVEFPNVFSNLFPMPWARRVSKLHWVSKGSDIRYARIVFPSFCVSKT
jgi:hypothetical protein